MMPRPAPGGGEDHGPAPDGAAADWHPELTGGPAPAYERLLDALRRDIASGLLPVGGRLPPHRTLAHRLGISVGTVTRTYDLATRLGLIAGSQGRGTYVRAARPAALPGPSFATPPAAAGAVIDLSRNVPCLPLAGRALADSLARLHKRADFASLLDYAPHPGIPAHRAEIAGWLLRRGIDISADELVLTLCAQHAIVLALGAVCRPGDRLLVEAGTYVGIKPIAADAGYRLTGLAMDAEGILPEALERACRSEPVRALYLIPTLQNPTTRTMSAARRQMIAALCAVHDVWIIEDDVYGFLAPDAGPAFIDLAPERSFYIGSAAKCMAPALRVGFLKTPAALLEGVVRRIATSVWMAPPLSTALVSMAIQDGTADRLIAQMRQEAARRIAIARRILPDGRAPADGASYHLWLDLPAVTAERTAGRLRAQGVLVTPPAAMIVDQTLLSGLRLCLGAPPDLTSLEHGLQQVADILRTDGDGELSLV